MTHSSSNNSLQLTSHKLITKYRNLYFSNLPLLVLILLPYASPQLIATQCQDRFASGRYGTAAIYDGDDAIYIIGGTPYGGYDISKYSISSDELNLVAEIPLNRADGTVSIDTQGNIYHHGGLQGQYARNEEPHTPYGTEGTRG